MHHPDYPDFLYCFEKACQREALKVCPAMFYITKISVFSAEDVYKRQTQYRPVRCSLINVQIPGHTEQNVITKDDLKQILTKLQCHCKQNPVKNIRFLTLISNL